MTKRLNKRQLAKAATRQKVLDAARKLWATPGSYERGTIRAIAREAGMSTGAIFANFDDKAALYAAAFETSHVAGDSALSRAAPDLFRALEAVVEIRCDLNLRPGDAYGHRVLDDAEALIERIKDQLLEDGPRLEADADAGPIGMAA